MYRERTLSLGLTDKGTKRIPWSSVYTTNTDKSTLPLLVLDDNKKSWLGEDRSGFIKKWAWPQSSQPYLHFDLGSIQMISRIGWTGQAYSSTDKLECYVKSLMLLFSPDAKTWGMVRHIDAGIFNEFLAKIIPVVGEAIPPAREDRYFGTGPFFTDIKPTVYARFIKLLLFNWYDDWCLKLEFYGNNAFYQESDESVKKRKGCDSALGMRSGRIRDRQIKGSSFTSNWANSKPANARLHKTGGWCVYSMEHMSVKSPYRLYAMNDTLEIDLLSETIIDGFATQGHSTSSMWVTGYVVHYSLDGLSWDIISVKHNGRMLSEKFFKGNTNSNGVVRHRLNPRIRARFLRFVPIMWHKWICMRIEVYGCSGGKSLKEHLDEQILELKSERVDFVPLTPRKTVTAECGKFETWGAPNYLSLILDKSQTTWSQRVFNNDYSLHKGSSHRFALAHYPQSFGFRHFFCSAKTRQGKEIFRQHYFVVPKGPKAPSNMKPIAAMDSSSSVDPQILVIQKLDPTYDGGKLIWTTPATVEASGSIGSIAVNVFGLAFYPVTIKNLVAKWRIEHGYEVLGKVAKKDFRTCARLALSKGYEYMAIIDDTSCISSWYLPLATIPFDTKYETDGFEDRDTYFIRGVWEDYEVTWVKLEQSGKETELLSYTVKWPNDYRTKVYSVETEEKKTKNYMDEFSHMAHFGKYRSYDKVYYGDSLIGSHVLDIMEQGLNDFGAYKFKIFLPGRKVRNEAIIELRHKAEPNISLPMEAGGCAGSQVEIPLTIHNYNHLHPDEWSITWKKTSPPRVASSTLDTSDPLKLRIKATENSHGEYTAFVKNSFGFASGKVMLEITTNYPSITWATPSPHVAIEGVSDELEIKTKSDDHLREILWFVKERPINKKTEHFDFPDDALSGSSRRKRLKLKNLKPTLKGKYKVVVNGDFCSFEQTFQVDIKVRPIVVIEPGTDFVMARTGQNATTFIASVRGGFPQPESKEMIWFKNNVPYRYSQSGRVQVTLTRESKGRWLSRLTINDLRKSDSGDYAFVLNMGTANITYHRKLRVLDAALVEKIERLGSSKKSVAPLFYATYDMTVLTILVTINLLTVFR